MMPPPTTARGMLGNFLRGVDLPAVGQSASPPPVRSPTSSSLGEISAAGAGGGGTRSGAGGCKSPRDGGGMGRGSGGRTREVRGLKRGKVWLERGTTEVTGTMATTVRRRGITT